MPDDYYLIDNFLKEYKSILLTDDQIENPTKNDFSLINKDEDVHQIYLTKEDSLNEVKIIEDGVRYYYLVSSHLLEFSLGGFYPYDKNSLQRARFYYIKAYYDNGQFIYKSDNFTHWCDELMKQFKKKFLKKYSKDNNCLYSESAIKWIEFNDAKLLNGGQQWSI